VNFGPLTAEIDWRVSGTPSYFNGYHVLSALLHGSQDSGRQPNFAALNRGRHLCLAGRPSRWTLAHILVLYRKYNRYCWMNIHTHNRFTALCLGLPGWASTRRMPSIFYGDLDYSILSSRSSEYTLDISHNWVCSFTLEYFRRC